MLLVGGCAMLTAGVLVPVHQQVNALEWQAAVMRVQATQVGEQADDYRRFADALAADDPVLLERLAYHHMRMKPVDRELVFSEVTAVDTDNASAPPPVEPFESLLHRPIARVGEELPEFAHADTRLTRLVRGPTHYLLLLAGVFCVIAGFLLPLDAPDRTADDWPA